MADKTFRTKAVHAGHERDKHFGASSVPIYPASLYAFPDADAGIAIHNYEKPGYFYGRLGNPTQEALEQAMAELESGEAALAFASGMAAISAAILTFAKQGDHIVAPRSMYATTTNLLGYLASNFGIATTFVDATDAENYRRAARPKTKILWIETPSNPTVQVTDIPRVVGIARETGVATIADNTFATPFNQRPLEMGVDVSVHSATKYLGGHSDLTAGVMVGSKETIETAYHGPSKFFGGNIAPQVAWLVLRGIKTLAVRMERHNENGLELARFLTSHPKAKEVFYPGLNSHINHDIAVRQMSGFGGMLGLDVGSAAAAKAFANSVKLCTFATSLGGVETIIQPVALMTHATLSEEDRASAGIAEGLIRISVGIEDIRDIIADVNQALSSES
jgi:methionine-gamma-lyase